MDANCDRSHLIQLQSLRSVPFSARVTLMCVCKWDFLSSSLRQGQRQNYAELSELPRGENIIFNVLYPACCIISPLNGTNLPVPMLFYLYSLCSARFHPFPLPLSPVRLPSQARPAQPVMSAKAISEQTGKEFLYKYICTSAAVQNRFRYATVTPETDFQRLAQDHPWLLTEVRQEGKEGFSDE